MKASSVSPERAETMGSHPANCVRAMAASDLGDRADLVRFNQDGVPGAGGNDATLDAADIGGVGSSPTSWQTAERDGDSWAQPSQSSSATGSSSETIGYEHQATSNHRSATIPAEERRRCSRPSS